MNNSTYPHIFPKRAKVSLLMAVLAVLLLPGLASAKTPTVKTKDLSNSPAVSSAANEDFSAASKAASDDLAGEAKQDFSGGFKSVGRGFSKGTQVTGRAFKTAGVTVGSTFKKVGVTIKNWFTGANSKPVEERSLDESASQYVPAGDLDAVGDEAKPSVKKTQAASEKKTDMAMN